LFDLLHRQDRDGIKGRGQVQARQVINALVKPTSSSEALIQVETRAGVK